MWAGPYPPDDRHLLEGRVLRLGPAIASSTEWSSSTANAAQDRPPDDRVSRMRPVELRIRRTGSHCRKARALGPPALRAGSVTQEVLDLVRARFGDHFGDLEPFGWGRDACRCAEGVAAFHRHRLAGLRGLSGCDEAGRGFPLARSHLALPELRPADRHGGRRGGRGGLQEGSGPSQCGRRLHPTGDRLARVCPGHLLAPDARLCAHPTT